MKIPTDTNTLKGILFIVAGSVLIIFFAGTFILYVTAILAGLWLLNKGLPLVELPSLEDHIRSFITTFRRYN